MMKKPISKSGRAIVLLLTMQADVPCELMTLEGEFPWISPDFQLSLQKLGLERVERVLG